jgi:hypothetical protein
METAPFFFLNVCRGSALFSGTGRMVLTDAAGGSLF